MNEVNIVREGWLHKRGKEHENQYDIIVLLIKMKKGLALQVF